MTAFEAKEDGSAAKKIKKLPNSDPVIEKF
jgi:hypothetical protein